MVRKYPQKPPMVGSVLKSIIVGETVLFFGAFYIWKKLSNERDYRKYYHVNRPRILEWYYWSLEYMSGSSPRVEDYKSWNLPLDQPKES